MSNASSAYIHFFFISYCTVKTHWPLFLTHNYTYSYTHLVYALVKMSHRNFNEITYKFIDFFFSFSPLCYNSLEFRTLFMFAIRWAWNIVQRHPEKRTRVCVNVVIESILIWITQARQYTNAVSSENVWHFSEHNQCDKTQLFMEKCCFSISFPSVSLV